MFLPCRCYSIRPVYFGIPAAVQVSPELKTYYPTKQETVNSSSRLHIRSGDFVRHKEGIMKTEKDIAQGRPKGNAMITKSFN